jgi:N-acetylglucosaminyl-diphospho-decaprenol L-rhamnosyltransferase
MPDRDEAVAGMPDPATPTLAVVSVSYGSERELSTLLGSLPDASSRPLDVVIADNLPEVGRTEEVVREAGARYLPMERNLGYGGAINAAVRVIPDSVEWVVITNPDVAFHPGAIDALLAVGEADARIASVGPLVRNADGTVYPSARSVPSIRFGVGHALFGNVWPGNPWTRGYHISESSDRPRDAGWLSGSCLVVRRAAFESVGGFDEEFFMYFEDVDLGYRFAKAGWRNRFTPSSEVTHTGGHSTTSESAAMVRAHHRSAERFIAKRYPGALYWPIRAVLLAGLRIRSAVAERSTRRDGISR